MKKSRRTNLLELDEEEKEILAKFEAGKLKRVANLKKEKTAAQKMARRTLRKDTRINIRLSSADVLNIKQMAACEGLPYQTLISSVLHKYASGQLRD